ncbi:MAG: chromate transporter [Alkaliphilus sp.]|nr:chromate transporter [Alkaliphilus sp.]
MNMIASIFLTFMKIGAFGFGGGLAMLPLIEQEIVHNKGWITLKELVDIIAIVEMTPGPIAVNSATFVGYKVGGFIGALAGSLGIVIVSFILMTILAKYFMKVKNMSQIKAIFRGIRPTIIALMLSAVISVGKTAITDFKDVAIAVIIFIALVKFKLNPILGIVLSGVLGLIMYGGLL